MDFLRGTETVTMPVAHESCKRDKAFSILLSGVLLIGVVNESSPADSASPDAAEFNFDSHEVELGLAKHQTIVTGFILGRAVADLVVVSVNENDDRQLRIYAFGDGSWAPKLDATLRPEVLFVDVANISGRERLILYEHGHLKWFDPDTAEERALVDVATNYNAASDGLGYAPPPGAAGRVLPSSCATMR